MSDVVEKTLAALPKLFGDNSLLGGIHGQVLPKHVPVLGPSFQNFVRLLHKIKTKYEEEQFIKTQLNDIKEQFKNSETNKERSRDLLFQCVYCRMLGYDVDFAKIESLRMLSGNGIFYKRMGFLTANLLIESTDEVALLATSSILMNAKSSDLLENLCAFSTAAHLSMPATIETLHTYILDIMNGQYQRELVRSKATMCVYIYYTKCPDFFLYQEESFYKRLCDPDPSVMAVSCHIFYCLVQKDRTKYSCLVPILVNILQQITQRKLPASFEYHSIPSPWLQIKMLKILALLGADNQRDSHIMYPVLQAVFERTNMKDKMAFAICYECIMTCTNIYPNPELLQTAAKSVGNFLRSQDITLKYIGIKALTGLVRVSQEFALQYQMMVVELLDDPDETIRRKTLILLYNMTNKVNVQPVCEKLLEHMMKSRDNFHKEDLLHKIIDLIQKFFKPDVWLVSVLFRVLQMCPSSSSDKVMDTVLSTLKKGMSINKEFCQHMVKKSIECLFRKDLLPDVTKLASWIIEQQSGLLKNMPKDKLIGLFTNQLCQQHICDMTKLWLISALRSLVQCNILISDVIEEPIMELLKNENSVLIKEKLEEIIRLSQTKVQLNLEKSKTMDFTLSFLDGYVAESLMNGGSPYKPKHMRYKQTQQEQGVTELFKGIQNQGHGSPAGSSKPGDDVSSSDGTSIATSDVASKLPTVKRVWGKEGRLTDKQEVGYLTGEIIEDQISEEDKNRQQLVSALFGGITSEQIEEKENTTQDPFFTDDDNYDLKNMKTITSNRTVGWRQLHNSSSNSIIKNEPHLQNSPENIFQDENQSSQKLIDDLFDEGEHTFSKLQSDDESLEKHLDDKDLSTTNDNCNLYGDFLDDCDKLLDTKSNLNTDSASSKSLYDDDVS